MTRFIVIRFSSLGDIVLTTPVLRALHRTWADAHVTYVTKEAYRPLFEADPHVQRVVALKPGMRMTDLVRVVGRTDDDRILDLHATLRTRLLRHHLPGHWTVSRPPRARRLGVIWTTQPATGIRPVARRHLDVARALGAIPDDEPARLYTAEGADEDAARLVSGDYVLLAPGAQHCTKRWPAPHWRALATALHQRGIRVVAAGLAHEADAVPARFAIPAFGLTLATTVALCRRARVVIANDSGLMHVATAVGTPVVALFGPTLPELGFAPYRARARVLEQSLPCRPCSSKGGAHCPAGHHRCLEQITPEMVTAAVEAVA